MADPAFENSSRGDLAATGLVYDSAMNSSADKQLQNNLRGTESAKGLLGPDAGFEAGLGGGDKALSQAIQNKYAQVQGGRDRQFMHEQKNMANQMHFEKIQHASELVNREQQMNFEKALEKKRREQASKAARAGIVGQVLGIVGAVAGGVVGGMGTMGIGAAGGATAGYAAGSALGNSIGGA